MTASSRSAVPPFYAMQALSEAKKLSAQGRDIVHLSLGQPSTRPPKQVLEEVTKRALDDPLGYTESAGIAALRARIAQHYEDQYGLSIDPARVFVTVGSSAAYMLALLCAFDVGDEVALVAPHYPASPNMMHALGLKPIVVRAGMEQNYQPTLAMLEALPKTPKGLVIASPSNPAGTVIAPDELRRITDYCADKGIRIISDEIYHGVTFGDAMAETVLRFSDDMIVTNSFSKYYLLPGWRLGWCVLPEDLCEPAEALLQNFYISPPTLAQYAALQVMDCRDALDEVVAGYDANRTLLLEALPGMGLPRIAPAQGAFYLYADVSQVADDSAELCRRWLHEAGVCAVPGMDFDKEQGHRFVRLSYAGSHEDMHRACERLSGWLNGNK